MSSKAITEKPDSPSPPRWEAPREAPPSFMAENQPFFARIIGLGGRFAVEGEAIRFTPTLPFVAGMDYAVVDRGEARAHLIQRPAREIAAETVVAGLYPTATTVPL